jgi:hypothetical protein
VVRIQAIRYRNRLREQLVAAAIRQLERLGGKGTWDKLGRVLSINQRLRVRIVFLRHERRESGASFWRLQQSLRIRPDFTMAVRMDQNNQGILDYFLLPARSNSGADIRFAEHNGAFLDTHRFETLEALVALAAQPQPTEVK